MLVTVSRQLAMVPLKLSWSGRSFWSKCGYWFLGAQYSLSFVFMGAALRTLEKKKTEQSDWSIIILLWLHEVFFVFYYVHTEQIQWNQFWELQPWKRKGSKTLSLCKWTGEQGLGGTRQTWTMKYKTLWKAIISYILKEHHTSRKKTCRFFCRNFPGFGQKLKHGFLYLSGDKLYDILQRFPMKSHSTSVFFVNSLTNSGRLTLLTIKFINNVVTGKLIFLSVLLFWIISFFFFSQFRVKPKLRPSKLLVTSAITKVNWKDHFEQRNSISRFACSWHLIFFLAAGRWEWYRRWVQNISVHRRN